MPKSKVLLLMASLALTIPARLPAQETAPDSTALLAARRTLRSDLRNFVTAQETFYADHLRYARSMGELADIYRPSRGVTIVMLASSDRGHSEVAVDARAPDLVCAMYVGNAAPPLGTGGEGEVACRDSEGRVS